MNTMQYSRICENIDFFLILSLDIGFDLLFWFIYMYFNLYGGQNVQTFQKIDPLVMTSVNRVNETTNSLVNKTASALIPL